MGRSRSRTPSRKKSRRRSTSRSKHSKKGRHRTPERKSSKYRHRSVSSSDSTSRYKSSSKYQSKRRKRDSRSPSRSRKYRRSTSSSSSSSRSSRSSSSSSSNSRSRSSRHSSSQEKSKNKPSSNYIEKLRAMRTPTPPPSKLNFDASMEFLDKRHVTDSLAEINADEFRPKTFSSASNSKGEKSDADVLKVKGEVKALKIDSNDDPLFHQKVFGDDDARMEQWVHRVWTYRQKMFAPSN